MLKKLIGASFFVAASTSAIAADLPKEMFGKYGYPNDTSSCLGITPLEIGKGYVNFGTEAGCQPKTVKKTGLNQYSVSMICSSEGESSKTTSHFHLQGSTLTVDKTVYIRCNK